MAEEIRIPKLGMSATEVVLSEWMFGDGEQVSKGEIIYTAETDKTTVEIEAQASGTIRPTGEEGAKYKVGDLIGTIEKGPIDEGEVGSRAIGRKAISP